MGQDIDKSFLRRCGIILATVCLLPLHPLAIYVADVVGYKYGLYQWSPHGGLMRVPDFETAVIAAFSAGAFLWVVFFLLVFRRAGFWQCATAFVRARWPMLLWAFFAGGFARFLSDTDYRPNTTTEMWVILGALFLATLIFTALDFIRFYKEVKRLRAGVPGGL